MRLVWKCLILSIGGGVLITVALFFFDAFADFSLGDVPRPIEAIPTVVFWPVGVCLYLLALAQVSVLRRNTGTREPLFNTLLP